MRKEKGRAKGMTGLRGTSNPKGGTALFHTFKNKHLIKMGCDGLAWLLWTLPDEYRFSCLCGRGLSQWVKEFQLFCEVG